MFIDIHVHVTRIHGPPRGKSDAFCTPEQLIGRFDPVGIEKAVLLPLVSPETYLPQSNEDILEMVEKFPGRFIPFCNVDPRAVNNSADSPLDEVFRYYKERGAKGIGEITANLPFRHPMVQNLFKHAEATGLPVTFHVATHTTGGVYGLYDEQGLPGLEFSLAKFPALKFFGHSQAFWSEMGSLDKPEDRGGYPNYPIRQEGVVPKLMRKYKNLYGDLSAGSGHNSLARDLDHAVKFLDEFQDRLFFGTDICAPETGTPFVDLLKKLRNDGRISETVFQKVARENAIRVLGL